MDSNKSLWSGLPSELIERVLSFLPVPDLCRFRSVCKRWNQLLCKPSFHDLCELNRKNAYLFVTRYLEYADFSMVDPTFKRTTSFLDIEARRWYLIKPGESRATWNSEKVTQLLAVDDGLICDLAPGNNDGEFSLVVSDVIARTRRELPESPIVCHPDDELPIIVTAVDDKSRSYKVFVLNNNEEEETGMYVYESCTNEWRSLKNPPEVLGARNAVSAVALHGILYTIFRQATRGKFVLLRYNLQEDSWKEVSMSIPRKKRHPQLVVSSNRLFVMMWMGVPCGSCSEQGPQKKFHLLFELREILVTGSGAGRVVAQISKTHLQQIFDEQDRNFDIAYAVPCINSSGACQSIVLMTSLSGKLISYDLVNRSAVVLPAHPLIPPPFEDYPDPLVIYYQGKYTNLSLRNLSSRFLE